jgi:hypothetical protein
MDAGAKARQRTAERVGLFVFLAVLIFSDWLGYAASPSIFRWYPGAVPNTFYLVLDTARGEGPYDRYVPVSWHRLAETKQERGIQNYRVSVPNGYIPGPKMQFSFAVLEDDGRRQLVEVSTTGVIKGRSRYEAYADRLVPIAYQGYAWEYGDEGGGVPRFVVLACVIGLLIAFAAGYGVKWMMGLLRSRVASRPR